MLLGIAERVCPVCARATARYRCPACQLPYCSAACYSVHDASDGRRCTEAFAARELSSLGVTVRDAGGDAARPAAARIAAAVRADVASRGDAFDGGGFAFGGVDAGEFEEAADAAAATPQSSDGDRDAELLAAAVADLAAINGGGGVSRAPPARISAALAAAAAAEDGAAPPLSADEQRAFLRAAASGELSAAIARDWQPWWMVDCAACHAAPAEPDVASPDAASVAATAAAAAAAASLCLCGGAEAPRVPCSLRSAPPPALTLLTRSAPPAEPLSASVAAVVLAYAALQRLYVGDWEGESPLELAALLLHLCPVLAEDARHACVAAATIDFLGALHSSSALRPPSTTAALQPLRDAATLLRGGCGGGGVLLLAAAPAPARGRHYAVDALMHCRAAVLRAAAALPPSSRAAAAGASGNKSAGMASGVTPRTTLLLAARKLLFLAAWSRDAWPDAAIGAAADEVEARGALMGGNAEEPD